MIYLLLDRLESGDGWFVTSVDATIRRDVHHITTITLDWVAVCEIIISYSAWSYHHSVRWQAGEKTPDQLLVRVDADDNPKSTVCKSTQEISYAVSYAVSVWYRQWIFANLVLITEKLRICNHIQILRPLTAGHRTFWKRQPSMDLPLHMIRSTNIKFFSTRPELNKQMFITVWTIYRIK